MDERQSQCDQILEYMKSGNKITPLEAEIYFGSLRLGARIWDLKHKRGIPVKDEWHRINKRKKVKRYYLEAK
jgi:hypothetical protein